MIVLDLSILNQKGTPMFNSDTFANRPAFGIVGRIFISTDTKEFFRDTGTSWELIGGPGSGTITGSGAATQVAFWNGASTITGSNNLFWDSTNNYLGISTNTPTTALDVHHSTNSGAIFNQTTATNNNTINFQTSGSGRWRIGNFYTAGADDFGIFDVVGSLQQLTILKTTGQTFIGAKTTASGRLVVNSATADNHLQIVGANSPSIRIDNAGSGGTQRFVFGLATATNNFIQGATAGEFCISTQSAGNMLFGMWQTTNASEVMRITTANNLLIGTSIDGGFKLSVLGTSNFNGAMTATTGAFGGGSVTAGNNIQSLNGHISTYHNVNADTSGYGLLFYTNNGGTKNVISSIVPSGVGTSASGQLLFATTLNGTSNVKLIITEGGNLGQGTLTPASLWSGASNVYHVKSSSTDSAGVRVQSNRGGNIEIVCSGTTDEISLYSTTNWPLVIYTNATERLRFLTSGDVKITNSIEIGNSVSASIATPSTHKVSILIGGVQYYLLASNI
jgi:hypothetical protein